MTPVAEIGACRISGKAGRIRRRHGASNYRKSVIRLRAQHPPGARFPAWTFDTKRGKAAFYAGPGALYQYDAVSNRWTLTGISGGPTLPSMKASQSMAYANDPDDTYVWKSTEELWQLPGSAISSSGETGR